MKVHVGVDGEPAATGEPEYPLDDEASDSRLRFEDGTFAAFDEWHPESPQSTGAVDEGGKSGDEDVDDPAERAEREAKLREQYCTQIDIHRMSSEVVIDELIPPTELRNAFVDRFDFYAAVEKSLPEKKHGTVL